MYLVILFSVFQESPLPLCHVWGCLAWPPVCCPPSFGIGSFPSRVVVPFLANPVHSLLMYMESMIRSCFVFVMEADLLPKTCDSHWGYFSTWDLRFFGFTYIWILDGSQSCYVDFARGQCLLFWYMWALENCRVFLSFLQCESRRRIMIRISRQLKSILNFSFYYKCFLYMSIYIPCICLVPTETKRGWWNP